MWVQRQRKHVLHKVRDFTTNGFITLCGALVVLNDRVRYKSDEEVSAMNRRDAQIKCAGCAYSIWKAER